MPQGQSDHHNGSLLTGVLCFVTRAVSRRPRLTLVTALLTAAVCVGLTVSRMDFKTRRADLIDPKAEFQQRWLKYTETFGDANDVVVVVEGDGAATIKQALDDVGSKLKDEKSLFANVLYKIEAGPLQGKGLHYLTPKQLEAGLGRLSEMSPILDGRWDLMQLESLFGRFHQQVSSRGQATSHELRPLLEHAWLVSTSMRRWLDDPNDFSNPWPRLIPLDQQQMQAATGQPIYFLNETETMGFLKAQPTDNQTNFNGQSKSLDRLREIVAEVSGRFPEAKVSLTGIPVLENDEMRKSQSDMTVAGILSYVGVLILMLVGYRGWRHPLLAMIVMAIGMAWSFGFTTLAVGHLNILSVSFAAILIGLGDFSVCFLSRYLELRHEGRPLRPALVETSATVGSGIVTAAITTAMSFFCATLTDFLGVAELGIIAGGGMLLCMLAVFIVLPALIAIADESVEVKKLPTPFQANWLRKTTQRFPWLVMAGALLIMIGAGTQAFTFKGGVKPKVAYDYNLLNLQAEGLESVDVQKRIFDDAHDSLLFAVSVADTPEEARQLREKFEKLPGVHHVEELASRLPSHTPDDTKLLVQAFRARLARVPQQVPQLATPNPSGVGRSMEQLYLRLRKRKDKESQQTAQAIDAFLDQFEKLSIQRQIQFLAEYQYRMSASLLYQFQAMAAAATTPRAITLEDLPKELTSRFVSKDGKWLVQVYPKDELWDIGPLQRFVEDVRTVDPGVTGVPLQNYEASQQIRASYEKAALYAFGVVWVVLLIDFLKKETKWLVLAPPAVIVAFLAMTLMARRVHLNPVLLVSTYIGMSAAMAAILDARNLRDAILGMMPPVLGGLMMFGVLGLLGENLNAANLICLPLVLGIGVDNGVHVVHDFRRQTGAYIPTPSMINANVVTSLTTMVGFGSMMVAAHRGLYSLGLVLTVGVACSLFVSLVLLPSILTILSRRAETGAGAETHRLDDRRASNRPDMQRQPLRRAA